jgi:hypothetical protein
VDCERSCEKCEDDVTGVILPGILAVVLSGCDMELRIDVSVWVGDQASGVDVDSLRLATRMAR